MATESWLLTALPHSASPGEAFHVSLFVTHRLTPDGAEGVVDDFALVRDWAAHLRRARIVLRGGGGPAGEFDIPVAPILDVLDDGLWRRVFPGALPVRPWKVPDYTAAPWQSFPAHRMQAYGLFTHAAALLGSPVTAPGAGNNPYVRLVLQAMGLDERELRLTRVIDGEVDRAISKRLDDLARGGKVGIAGASAGSPVLAMLTDLHAARRFYQRPEDRTDYRERPLPGAQARPVRKPTPDFHERAGLLGDLSPLLRRLGLVIDLRVQDVSRLAGAAWIQAGLVMRGAQAPQTVSPRTSCQVVGQTFTVRSATDDYDLGMLCLGDESRFVVLDLDPDATALKLEQYARQMPRIVAAADNGDAMTTAPSTLRATGFAVARVDRAAQLHDRLDGAASRDAALLAGTAAPLRQEEISRGVRLEVWDDVSGQWHSLHRRRLSVDIAGVGRVLDAVPDTGFLQGAALTSSDQAPDGPKYAHEVLAGWDGWSLSAPRPGKVVVHDGGDERVLDAPPPDPAPVNPVASTTEVAPGTLPRLRYGRRYAFRAYAVDLAGNSRPHTVGGPDPGGAPRAEAPDAAPLSFTVSGGGTRPSPVGGLVVTAAEAAAHATRRQRALPADALRVASLSPDRGGLPVDVLKAHLAAASPACRPAPDASTGAAGLDPAGLVATSVPEVDRLVAARLADRARSAASTPLSRAQQAERAFLDAASRAEILIERTDRRTEATVAGQALATAFAQQTGIAAGVRLRPEVVAGIAARLTRLITTVRPFLRWDALIEPAVVPRTAYTEGESLLRLVIRSGVTQVEPGGLDVALTDPATYAAETVAAHPELDLAWRADTQRHVAPPKCSQFDAELHGAFDAAMGTLAPDAAVRTALGIALREAGSFMDTTIADLANPGGRLPQPGVAFHVTPTAETPDVAAPEDLPDGAPLTPGQYVAHDVDQVALPYLPDPIARGISLMFPDAGTDHRLADLFALEGTTLDYPGTWPERVPFRLVLESGPSLGAVVDGHVVRVTLPPGEQLRVRLGSAIDRASLDLLGLWASLPAAIRDNPFLREVAADGWFWWLTPSTELRFVHAVPRPVEVPRPTILVPLRTPNGTSVTVAGAVDVHGPSTDRLDVEAEWSQWVDDVTKPGPERVHGTALAFGTSVGEDEDLVVLSGADATVPLPDGRALRLHAAVHQIGDTLHRTIDYRVRATTRYREYFHPLLTPAVDDLSVVGPTRTLNVPSSARPPKVGVRDVLPLFRWDERTEPGDPFGLQRTRRPGLRLYLDRPWYATGDGELLGVVLAAGSDATLTDVVSQWGGDPVFRQQGPASRGALALSDVLHLSGLDDRREPGRPAAPPVLRPLVDRHGAPNVWVLGYQPEFSEERGLWFVDVAFDPGTAFWPFVRLAVARYQPDSLPGMHLGPITPCDFAQLVPGRTATLSRPDETHVRVAVTGATGYPRDPLLFHLVPAPSDFLSHVARSRRMRARLERFDPAVGTDLGWVAVGQWDLPILGIAGTVCSWAGELPLPVAVPPRTPGTNAEWRVTVEEWELLPADYEAGGTGGWQPRIVYADHLPL
ncbi:MAG: hypothetical protein R2745_01205 [Vicinamibacterales bacterium]